MPIGQPSTRLVEEEAATTSFRFLDQPMILGAVRRVQTDLVVPVHLLLIKINLRDRTSLSRGPLRTLRSISNSSIISSLIFLLVLLHYCLLLSISINISILTSLLSIFFPLLRVMQFLLSILLCTILITSIPTTTILRL